MHNKRDPKGERKRHPHHASRIAIADAYSFHIFFATSFFTFANIEEMQTNTREGNFISLRKAAFVAAHAACQCALDAEVVPCFLTLCSFSPQLQLLESDSQVRPRSTSPLENCLTKTEEQLRMLLTPFSSQTLHL